MSRLDPIQELILIGDDDPYSTCGVAQALANATGGRIVIAVDPAHGENVTMVTMMEGERVIDVVDGLNTALVDIWSRITRRLEVPNFDDLPDLMAWRFEFRQERREAPVRKPASGGGARAFALPRARSALPRAFGTYQGAF